MRLSRAMLIKHTTQDGFFTVKDDVPLHKIYDIDLDSICLSDAFNKPTGTLFQVETVDVYEPASRMCILQCVGRFPTELLFFNAEA